MNAIVFGLLAGVIFGAVDVALMIPMTFPDKRTAMLAAFCSRFAIGFLIPLVRMPVPPWLTGAIVGLLISLPDAIVTKAYAPILASGVVGGAIIGFLAGRFVTA
jgi:fructose-specific phosphotransferase system IIC component